MRYCDRCGTGHECAGDDDRVNAEVEIERLRTKRDIEVARIQASAAKDIAETEAETDLAHAEGEADGMREVIEAVAGGGEDESEPEPVVETIPVPEPEIAPEPDIAPPPVVETGKPSGAKSGGWWANYR